MALVLPVTDTLARYFAQFEDAVASMKSPSARALDGTHTSVVHAVILEESDESGGKTFYSEGGM